ncbi:MAG: hypothetical protein LBL45_04005 [Treponema sp.]|nr:hypothetical protein [Treponema sp.]
MNQKGGGAYSVPALFLLGVWCQTRWGGVRGGAGVRGAAVSEVYGCLTCRCQCGGAVRRVGGVREERRVRGAWCQTRRGGVRGAAVSKARDSDTY